MTNLGYTGGDLAAEFTEQAPARVASDGELSRVASLGEELAALEVRIEKGEAFLKTLKEQRRLIAEGTLPEAMDAVGACGLRDFTLNDGSRVSVALKYRCGQLDDLPPDPKKDKQRPLDERLAALAWLADNGHADLARRTVTIVLGPDSAEAEAALKAYVESLRLNSLRYTAANVVPWNTLSAFTRDLDSRADGVVLFDLLGVQKVRVAEVKRVKTGDEL